MLLMVASGPQCSSTSSRCRAFALSNKSEINFLLCQHNENFFQPYLALLNDDAYHPSVAVVDDFLEGVLEFHLAVFGHLADFGLDAVFYDLLDGFPKYVGVPYAVFFFSGIFFHVGD